MKKHKLTVEERINKFLEVWDLKQQIKFLHDVIPIFELYNVEKEDDWLEKIVGGDYENVRTIRIIRTVYLLSRLCAFHAGKMCLISVEFKDLWQAMEKEANFQGS